MKKLGFGLMRLPLMDPKDDGSIDVEQAAKMTDIFLERGFTYFDTAWMYHNFSSESAAKQFLVDRHPRESFTLTSKLPSFFINTKEDRDTLFHKQLEKTGAGYFDYYLLHDMNSVSLEKFEKLDCFEWIKEQKAKGLVKSIGFSCHDNAEFVEKILSKHPEMEFVQLQINYVDWESTSIEARKCYEVACKYDKPVIVMEPIRGGTLANLPEEAEKILKDYDPTMSTASWAVRFAASLDNVMMVLSGMSNVEQLMDNTDYMADFKPLTEEEKALCMKVADYMNDAIEIPCTGCAYCKTECPKQIAIPDYFHLYNLDKQELPSKVQFWSPQQDYYENAKKNFGKPSECIECGKCEEMCPQHLEIRELLKKVDKHFSSYGN